ncbi:L-fucose-proton symporter [Lachnellula suecica]|uniref:L-fucose-proton symporter n=1 Tax=Lachnellula suecica TaxID=602035 RepID=A0A8T9CH44_9HELO|nr:L-fucose-proton symporter [Lachnellula suecica]
MTSIDELQGRGRAVFVVTTTTFVLATLFVVARLISRFGILRHRTADDLFIILAWADWRKFLAFGLSFAIDYGASKGLGRHDGDIPQEWQAPLRRSEYAFTILYNPALMATKTSILIFYLRMSKNTQSILRIASYVTLAIVNIDGIVLTFLNAFQCNPISAAYNPSKHGQCLSIVTLYLCSAPVNIITDLAILVLPIPVLTGMQLPQRQKTILVLTFALGIFVTIVDVVRIYYLQQASSDQTTLNERLGTTSDFAYNASTAFLWSAVEVNVGIICACIPTMKPLVRRILPSMLRDLSKRSTERSGSFSSQTYPGDRRRMSSLTRPIPAIQPLPNAQPGADQEAEVDMMDFLTAPGAQLAIARTQTHHTYATANSVYFGFVNMRRPKSMLKTKGMESFKYCTLVTILFFLWGFSYGLLNTLNSEIGKIAKQNTGETLGLSASYFAAYVIGSLTVGQWTLRHGGFKATFITGLCIYGTGTLMFWPCAVLTSFPGFIISNFVVGFGLAVLETAANPFIALCGPSQFAEFRLLLAQGVQALASIFSQLLAERVLFQAIQNKTSLIDVQWTYLAIALLTVILALFFYYMPLPEATDQDLQVQSEDLGVYPSDTIFSSKLRLIYLTLGMAVFAQFCYVAGQESMSVWFGLVLENLSSNSSLTLTADNYILVGHTTFAVGRFLFAPLCLFISPRILLMIAFIGCTVFAILTMALHISANGIAGPALVFFFYEGPIWPIVYAIGLRGLGRKTKMGSALLTASVGGGAIFPFVMWAVQKLDNKSLQDSYCVIVALFSFGSIFPIYLNFVPKARRQVDPAKDSDPDDERPETPIRRLSKRLSIIISKFGGGKSGPDSPELPIVEHREESTRNGS